MPANASSAPDELRNPFTGQTIRFLFEDSEVLVLESSYQAGGAPAPAHLHPAQEERFTVLSGSVRASVDGAERILGAGEEVLVPAGTPHEFGGNPEEPGTVRWEVRPPLRTRAFFEHMFAALQAAADEQAGSPSRLAAPFDVADYDDVFRLP